jgi:hypothetical protein
VNCYGLLDTAVGMAGYKLSGYGTKGGPGYVDPFLYEKCVYINMACGAASAGSQSWTTAPPFTISD